MKDTLITTRAEAKQIILRRIEQLGNVSTLEDFNNFMGWHGCIKQEASTLIEFNIFADNHDLTWRYLSIAEHLRGKKLGLLMIKGAIALAHELSLNRILLWNTIKDGPGFWSWVGAVPMTEQRNMHIYLLEALHEHDTVIKPETAVKIQDLINVSKKNWLAGWRLLAQLEDRTQDGVRVRSLIFHSICAGKNLQLRLDDPETQTILRSKVGVIPDFPASNHRPLFPRRPVLDSLPPLGL